MLITGSSAAFVYNLRLPGQYYDSETGLFYNMARDYNPGTGRYIQSDPIGLKGGVNTYVYVGGNPVTGVDPYGLVSSYDIYKDLSVVSKLGGSAALYLGQPELAIPLYGFSMLMAFGAELSQLTPIQTSVSAVGGACIGAAFQNFGPPRHSSWRCSWQCA